MTYMVHSLFQLRDYGKQIHTATKVALLIACWLLIAIRGKRLAVFLSEPDFCISFKHICVIWIRNGVLWYADMFLKDYASSQYVLMLLSLEMKEMKELLWKVNKEGVWEQMCEIHLRHNLEILVLNVRKTMTRAVRVTPCLPTLLLFQKLIVP
jgi:hypothetical protein